jgi:hypothetical protein
MIETLKFPSGDFTHSELATLNGKTNQQVWTRYQAAIKDGVIVSAGERASAGRGKPSKLWRVASGQPVPIVTAVPVAPPTPKPPKTPKVPKAVKAAEIVPTEAVVVPAVVPPAPAAVEPVVAVVELPVTEPAQAPVVVDVVPSPAVVEAVTEAIVTTSTVAVQAKNLNARTLKDVCPVCKTALLAIDDATGVMVWCSAPPEVCKSTENPFGHSNNEKSAYAILCEKFKHIDV